MKNRTIVVSLFPLLFLAACTGNAAPTNVTPPPPSQGSQASAVSLVGTKLSDSPLAASSYLISESAPTAFDAATKAALAGYDVQSAMLPDGSKQITLHATNPQYHDQSFTLKPGQKLYFVEKYLQDDPNGEEKNEKDDWGIVTDSGGTVVSTNQ